MVEKKRTKNNIKHEEITTKTKLLTEKHKQQQRLWPSKCVLFSLAVCLSLSYDMYSLPNMARTIAFVPNESNSLTKNH